MIEVALRKNISSFIDPLDELIADALANGQRVSFRTISGSMNPTIRPGSTFDVMQMPVQVGDIVLANVDGTFKAHRLISSDDDHLFLRGDANRTGYRETIRRSDLIGKVVAIHDDTLAKAHRLGNQLRPFLPSPLWRALRSVIRRGPGASWGVSQ